MENPKFCCKWSNLIKQYWAARNFFKTKYKRCKIYLIHLPFSCKHWTLTAVIEKTLTLPKHEDIMLHSMTQTREKWQSIVLSRADFWLVWRCHGIPCFYFIFLFRTNGKKEYLHENNLRDCYGNFSQRLCSKFFLSSYKAYWQWHLKDTLQFNILRTGST